MHFHLNTMKIEKVSTQSFYVVYHLHNTLGKLKLKSNTNRTYLFKFYVFSLTMKKNLRNLFCVAYHLHNTLGKSKLKSNTLRT